MAAASAGSATAAVAGPVTRRDEIVVVARQLLEDRGPTAVTMRAIADQMGIRAPSLYKHIADKAELEVALTAVGLQELAGLFEADLSTSPDPLVAMAVDYRAWAHAHPHLYRLMNTQPLPRDRLPEGVEMQALQPLLTAFGGDRARARAVWAFAHGMVTLELAGRFPPDADLTAAWAAGLAGFTVMRADDIAAALRAAEGAHA